MSRFSLLMRRKFGFPFLIASGLLLALRFLAMPLAGHFLVNQDPPVKTGVAVVLAGDANGLRVLKGAELRRDGLVDKVLVSGGPGLYGFHESELAIQFAVKRGFPEEYFEALHRDVHSTQEEAHEIVLDLKRRGIRRALVVTSDYHTRRAGWIWRHTAPWLDLRMVASPDRDFRSERWWYSRDSSKLVFNEWVKLLSFTLDFFPPERSGPVPAP